VSSEIEYKRGRFVKAEAFTGYSRHGKFWGVRIKEGPKGKLKSILAVPGRQVPALIDAMQAALERAAGSDDDFYNSPRWFGLRYLAFKKYGSKCACCGTTEGQLHADHIIPRSIDPSKELELDNIQILCRSCNLAKSNTDSIDWAKRKQDGVDSTE